MNMAGAQATAFQIAELVEDEQRVVTGAAEGWRELLPSCPPWVGLTPESMSRTMVFEPRRALSIQAPESSVSSA